MVRYTLTLNEPNLLPADVKKRQLAVQRHEVRIAAESPIRSEFKFLTVRLDQHGSCNLKPFSPFIGFRTAQGQHYASVYVMLNKRAPGVRKRKQCFVDYPLEEAKLSVIMTWFF